MGIFYMDDSSENSLEKKRKYIEEVKEFANEMLQKAENIPDESYPEFLWKVQLNEFSGDDYRIRGTCTNPNVVKAYNIRRKYSSYWDFLDALNAYYDYVDYIDSAYGSFQMMKQASDDGYGTIFIPKKPKLTNKKKNRELLRCGFIPSRIDEDFIINPEYVDQIIAALPEAELIAKTPEYSKLDIRMDKKLFEKRNRIDRLNSIYASGVITSDTRRNADAIIAFLNSTSDINLSRQTNRSFTEEMESLHENDYIPEDILEYNNMPTSASIVNMMLVDNKKQEQIEILTQLEQSGFDFLGSSATKGIDKAAIRAVSKRTRGTTKIVNYDELTPKQIRKLKKKEAKRRRKAQQSIAAENRLQSALLHNRISVSRERFESGDVADFRIEDILPNFRND